jgi:UMF1 family MFS transporter
MEKNQRKLEVYSWGIYDFANTIYSMNIVTMYFAQWVIVDNHKEDIWYSISYALSMLLVALIMPVLGAISDAFGKRKPFLLALTLGCVAGTFFIGVVSNNVAQVNLRVYLALILFVVTNFSYEGGLVFYNSLLPQVSTPKNIGKISGLGVALGYVGAIAGLLLVKPFVEGNLFGLRLPFVSGAGREKAFIPTALFFLLFSLPLFLWVKERIEPRADQLRTGVKNAFKRVWEGLTQTKKYPGVLRFLIADYFFEDAIATVIIFMAVYAQVVMGMGDEVKIWFFIVSTTSAVAGSFLSGIFTDWIGPKKTLLFVVMGWIISLSVVMFTFNQTIFWIIGSCIGIFLGSTWTTSRPLLTSLVPKEMVGQFFGLYSLSGRAAAIIGPLLWGGAVLYFKKDNFLVKKILVFLESIGVTFSVEALKTIQYRFAVCVLILVMILGFIIFIKVPDRFKRKIT